MKTTSKPNAEKSLARIEREIERLIARAPQRENDILQAADTARARLSVSEAMLRIRLLWTK